MNNKELQEVVDALLQGMSAMEERLNKKFDEINDRFDAMEAKAENIEENIKEVQADLKIVTGKMEKQDLELKRLKRAMQSGSTWLALLTAQN